jgi:hypothetical protein
MRPLVIYHRNCFDGFTAAWVADRALGGADLHAAHYGEPPPPVVGRVVYVVDFSYPREVLTQMAGEAKSLVVLDHHATARDALDGFPGCWFDMNESGASLTWRYFHGIDASGPKVGDRPMPALVGYVKDRDLWRFELPESHAVNAWLRTHDFDLDEWDEIARRLDDEEYRGWAIRMGHIVRKTERKIVDAAVRHPRKVTIGGVLFNVTNATALFSEVAGELAQETGAGAVYFVRSDGRVQWSLRNSGKPDAPDVAAVAKQYGGGGHRGASGFDVSHDQALAVLRADTHDWLCLKCSGGSTEHWCADCGAGGTAVLAPKAAHGWLQTDFDLRWQGGREAGIREAAEVATGAIVSELFGVSMESRIKVALARKQREATK